MKKEKSVWVIAIITLWSVPSGCLAQQDSLQSRQLDELVVTATKFSKSLGETGKVLTLIDEDQIRRSAGKDLAQLLNEQGGVVVNGANSNPGKDKAIYLQGAGSQYTLILLDGVPMNDPSGVGGAFDLRLIPLDQIERIEILKGSQSTLYGTDAVAGVINIITKQKTSGPTEVNARISAGSYNTLQGQASVAGKNNLFDYRVGYSGATSDGISEAKDPGNTGTFDKDGYTQQTLQGSVGFSIAKSIVVRPSVRYTTFNGGYDNGAFEDSKDNRYDARLLYTGLHANYAYRKGAITFQYALDDSRRTFTGTPAYNGSFQQAEFFIRHDVSKVIQLLAGTSGQVMKMSDGTITEKQSVEILSPYATVFLTKGPWSVELGGRLNFHSQYGQNAVYSFNPSWRPARSLKVFANVSTGFKTPTLSQLYGQYGPNPNLKPEHSESYNAGFSWQAPGSPTAARLVWFNRRMTDLIFFSVDPVTFNYQYVNLNRQDDSGLELELSGKEKRLTWKASYAYVDGQITAKGATQDTTYHNLYRRPRHTASVYLGFQATERFMVSLNVRGYGERSDLYFNLTNFKSENVTLTPYTLMDIYLEYRWKQSKWKVFLDARNVLNQDYMEVYGYNTQRFNVMTGIHFEL